MKNMLRWLLPICASSFLMACSPDLPECDSKEVNSALHQILKPYIAKGSKITFENFLEQVNEGKDDNEIRICKAYLVNESNQDDNEEFYFKISWQNRDKSLFYTEIVEY